MRLLAPNYNGAGRTRQPSGAVAVNWQAPITQGLVGLLWVGDGYPRDLVTLARAQTAGTGLTTQSAGTATTVATAGKNGAYYARLDQAAWRQAGTLSLMMFGGHTTPTGTVPIAGYSAGSDGYLIRDYFGTRARSVKIQAGGSAREVAVGNWSAGTAVRGMTYDGATLTGYDDGVSFGTAAASGTVTYDGTFSRLFMLGNADLTGVAGHGYWLALWNLALTAAECRDLAERPWQLFATQRFFMPVSAGASASTFSATLSASLTASAAIARAAASSRSATTTGAATRMLAAQAQRQATSTTAATVATLRARLLTLAASVATTAAALRAVAARRAASVTSSASATRAASLVRSATSATSATVASIKAKLLTLAATIATSGVVRRAAQAIRPAAATASSALTRATSARLTASTSTSAQAAKAASLARAAATACTATLAAVRAKLLTLVASVAGSASVRKAADVSRSAAVGTAGQLRKAIGATRSALVSLAGLFSSTAGTAPPAPTLTPTATFVATIGASGRSWVSSAVARVSRAVWGDR